ncbi:diacylglycerol kinase [uncultured Jatrophihabitans sp.]|uniref:diacylglycerol kinase n=1 Tax=uncultured Jatrophihabitans sp. TaxID=1610747 RepID=UPI0035C94639
MTALPGTAMRRPVREVTMLVNPAAGRGAARRAADEAAGRLAERGVAVTEITGADAAASARLARDAVAAAGLDALVVVGGDGMVSLAWNALAGSGVPLGLVPAGTGNDHARAFDIPRRSPRQAADVVADGARRPIDLARATTADGVQHWFGSVLAAGFDSLVSDRANRLRWPRGRSRYNVAMLLEFARLRPLPFRVVADDRVIERDVLLVAVGNTSSYGGGMRICPAADPADGLLDVTVAAAAGRGRVLRQFPQVYRGTHVRHPEVETFQTHRVRIEAADGVGITAYADGDPLGPLPVAVEVAPGTGQILVRA